MLGAPVKFGNHRHCDNGGTNISEKTVILPQMPNIASMTLYARLHPLLLFSLKRMTCFALTHDVSN